MMDFGAMMQNLPAAMEQVNDMSSDLSRIAGALERIADHFDREDAFVAGAIEDAEVSGDDSLEPTPYPTRYVNLEPGEPIVDTPFTPIEQMEVDRG